MNSAFKIRCIANIEIISAVEQSLSRRQRLFSAVIGEVDIRPAREAVSRFHSLSPWRSNTSFIFTQLLCFKIAGVSDSRLRIYYTPFWYAMLRLFILFKNNLQIRMIAHSRHADIFLEQPNSNEV